jgi:hypothetical protein
MKPKKKRRPTSLLATLNAATALIAADGTKTGRSPDDSASLDNEVQGIISSQGIDQEDQEYDDHVRARWSFE